MGTSVTEHLEAAKTAVLGLHLQKHMTDPASRVAQHTGFAEMVKKTNLFQNINRVLNAAREKGTFIAYVKLDLSPGDYRYPRRGEFCSQRCFVRIPSCVLKPSNPNQVRISPGKAIPKCRLGRGGGPSRLGLRARAGHSRLVASGAPLLSVPAPRAGVRAVRWAGLAPVPGWPRRQGVPCRGRSQAISPRWAFAMPLVFSYGTLQEEGVQRDTFGRTRRSRRRAAGRITPTSRSTADPTAA
jgi:hypothetical protein